MREGSDQSDDLTVDVDETINGVMSLMLAKRLWLRACDPRATSYKDDNLVK